METILSSIDLLCGYTGKIFQQYSLQFRHNKSLKLESGASWQLPPRPGRRMDGGGKGWGELGPAEQCKAVAPDAQRSCYALKLSVVCVFVRNMNFLYVMNCTTYNKMLEITYHWLCTCSFYSQLHICLFLINIVSCTYRY